MERSCKKSSVDSISSLPGSIIDCTKLSVDFISSLPGCIIDCILGRLPLQEAVRTSILSREWRYKWTSVPKLVFDFQVDSICESVVYQVLHHLRGPINKFSLSCRTSLDIDKWIQLLPGSQVQDFTLLILGEDKHRMTSHFFAFQNLEHLCLSQCIFKPPPDFKGFSKLATLAFQYIEYVPAIFDHFISQSPLLETLRLVGCTELDAFEVQGPSLRCFKFHGVFKTICFKNSPVLNHAAFSIRIVDKLGNRSWTGFTCLQFPPKVEKLFLHPCVLEFLGAGVVPSRFAESLKSLKDLKIVMYLDSIKEVASAFCLARNSPNLHKLRIVLHAHGGVEAVVTEYIRAQETPDHYLHQLRRVEIRNFYGSETEIELLRYLLASAAELEEMVITINESHSHFDDMSLMGQLIQFPWASPTARLRVHIS